MDELQELMKMKASKLAEIIEHADKSLKNAPKGYLRISKNKNTDQYYWRTDPKNSCGKYIRKKEQNLIHQLAQKSYCKLILNSSKKSYDAINSFLSTYDPDTLDTIFNSLSPSKRRLITPYILPDQDFISQWQEKTYQTRYVPPEDDNIIYTERGEAVRSKSEKILADKFNLMSIPYHYEKPLYLKGYGNVYPDFTVLNVRTRREYYWEHLGLMDNSEYADKAIRKIESMQKNGIYNGEKLILTYETQLHPLNTKVIELMIQRYLL